MIPTNKLFVSGLALAVICFFVISVVGIGGQFWQWSFARDIAGGGLIGMATGVLLMVGGLAQEFAKGD